jgi:hypothetical protein
VKSSSKLIMNEKYDRLLGLVSAPKEKKESALIIKYRRLYSIVGNVERRCLYRQNKVVTTFENLFDVILEAHNQISNARSTKSNLLCIKNTLGYYGRSTIINCDLKLISTLVIRSVITPSSEAFGRDY